MNAKFRPSKWTTIISLCDVPLIMIGAISILSGAWMIAIVCVIGSIGLTVFHNSALAADYAKWRDSIEVQRGSHDANSS